MYSATRTMSRMLHTALWIFCYCFMQSSCMLAPLDGETVESRSEELTFQGFYNGPDTPIDLYSFIEGEGYRHIKTSVTSSTPVPYEYDEVELYDWYGIFHIPNDHWKPGRTGFVARLRARKGDVIKAFTFQDGWLECWNDNKKVRDFALNCHSPHYPDAFVYTDDFPTSTDLTVTQMNRTASGLVVKVRNLGRHGKVTKLKCSHNSDSRTLSLDEPLVPAWSKEFQVDLTSIRGKTVTCRVTGVNEDGVPEATSFTDNNSLNKYFP